MLNIVCKTQTFSIILYVGRNMIKALSRGLTSIHPVLAAGKVKLTAGSLLQGVRYQFEPEFWFRRFRSTVSKVQIDHHISQPTILYRCISIVDICGYQRYINASMI